MSTLVMAAGEILAVLSLIGALIALVSCGAWHVVYYGCHCRRNPIGKTALLSAVVLWIISAAIINLF